MKYNKLGDSGLYVSELSLGTMTFGTSENNPASKLVGSTGQALATRMVDLAIDAGVNLFDTANSYAMGESEQVLGKALGKRRSDVLIATKLYAPQGVGPNEMGTSRHAMMREVERSLQRLGTDYIDLYQAHGYDKETPLEETLRAFDDLVTQGKVRYIGVSNFKGYQLAEANALAQAIGTQRVVSLQCYYSLVGRELEREILPAALSSGMGTLIWSPLAGGYLTGKFSPKGEGAGRRKGFAFPPIDLDVGERIIEALQAIATDKTVICAQVAIAWLLHKQGVSSVILGARSEKQLVDNLGAAKVALSAEEIRQLDEVSALPLNYPEWLPKVERGVDPLKRYTDMANVAKK